MKHSKLITIRIRTGNAAFDDHEGGEVARIMRNAAKSISIAHDIASPQSFGLQDINGNTIGEVEIERDD